MDKLGIQILGTDLMTRLYNWRLGFVNEVIDLSFGAEHSLFLLVTSGREYRFTVEGDLELVTGLGQGDRFIRDYEFRWTESALKRSNGAAKITMINADSENEPSVFSITMGGARLDVKHEPAAGQPWELTDADRLGISMMLADVCARSMFAGAVS